VFNSDERRIGRARELVCVEEVLLVLRRAHLLESQSI
jgi:hypothetical protein